MADGKSEKAQAQRQLAKTDLKQKMV